MQHRACCLHSLTGTDLPNEFEMEVNKSLPLLLGGQSLNPDVRVNY